MSQPMYVSWSSLKTRRGVWGYSQDGKEYIVFKNDGCRNYVRPLEIEQASIEGSDCKDFVDNYKTDIDEGKYPIDNRRSDNKSIVMNSIREMGSMFYWTSHFDDVTPESEELAGGAALVFDLAADDPDLVVIGEFLETVYIQGGKIFHDGAPWGADLTIQVICPAGNYYYKNSETDKPCASDNIKAVITQAETDTVIASFVNKIHLYGDNYHGLDIDPKELSGVGIGYKVKAIVTNGDTPVAFKVWGYLQMCRNQLVD